MSLPFLTADRAFDPTVDDIALPFDDHDRWRRPYRPGPWRVAAAALLLLLASFVLLAAVIIAAAGSGGGGAVTCSVLSVLLIAVSLRLLRVGTWVSRPRAPAGAGCSRPGPWGWERDHRGPHGPAASALAGFAPYRAGSGPARLPPTGGEPLELLERPQRRFPVARQGVRQGGRHVRSLGRRIPHGLAGTRAGVIPDLAELIRSARDHPVHVAHAGAGGHGQSRRGCSVVERYRPLHHLAPGHAGCPARRGTRPRAGTSSASRWESPRLRPAGRRIRRRPSPGRCALPRYGPTRRPAGRPSASSSTASQLARCNEPGVRPQEPGHR